YYAAHRDLHALPGGEIVIFSAWDDIHEKARRQLADADVAIITSYCPDALAAAEVAQWSPALRVFYDLDTPVTLARLAAGEDVPYIGEHRLRDFDLVLSYTGGVALDALQTQLGARAVAPFYGSVDPDEHRPVAPGEVFRADLSYLGTFAADRQAALHELFLKPARERPDGRFMIAGSQYPADFPWAPNVYFVRHLSPEAHATFFCSSRLTLNVTRAAMAASGYCPSGRLFEAAACGVPIVSDSWPGLDEFFEPGREILVAGSAADVTHALDRSPHELDRIARAARERTLAQHTAAVRAAELEVLLEQAWRGDHQTVDA
ncbi:MAG: glycosyltransferase, partial [Chthoniobacteraceae bacterium]